MAKVQDTYNPVTGEYVKRISDWVTLDGSRSWMYSSWLASPKLKEAATALPSSGVEASSLAVKYDSVKLPSIFSAVSTGGENSHYTNGITHYQRASNEDTGFSVPVIPSGNEWKAYFNGWKMANVDGTSPYYKSEVPYTPATWAEWNYRTGNYSFANNSVTLTTHETLYSQIYTTSAVLKPSVKYGVLATITSNTLDHTLSIGNGSIFSTYATIPSGTVGNVKLVHTCKSDYVVGSSFVIHIQPRSTNQSVTIKDLRIFELPTGSQIEADFTNLSADELSAKYTFNGLCVKHWKKVTDGTGLTSTLPTASYEGYTPYRMIYQLATPEISYLTPKTAIPLYDTNTIVETNTLADCKADVTVGYKLKSGATAVAGDITAPTPDYMSAVNSVSELGDKKGIVRSPNIVTNGNFANGTTGWASSNLTNLRVVGSELLSDASSSPANALVLNAQVFQINYETGHKYYFRVTRRHNNIFTPTNFRVRLAFGKALFVGGTDQLFGTSESKIVECLSGGTTGAYLGYMFSTTSVWTGFTAYFSKIQLIDLTATFGAGNEPTQEQCNILFATWQDKASTQATLPTLRKIGTVADTYNPETGVLVQKIGKKVFDGTETWSNDTVDWIFWNDVVVGISNVATALCSHAVFKKKTSGFTTANFTNSGAGYLEFYSGGRTIAQFKSYLAQQYANGKPVTVYYQLATPVVTTLATTALPTYKPTTVIESDSTVKGNVSADYKLKANATPVARDFIASPECVNDIKDFGNSIDVVSSVGRRNLLPKLTNISTKDFTMSAWGSVLYSNQKVLNMLVAGETYTISYDMELVGKTNVPTLYSYNAGLYLYSYSTENDVNFQNGVLSNLGQKIHAKTTFVCPPLTDQTIMLYTNRYTTNGVEPIGYDTIKFTNLKLEKGSTASPWTPEQEDGVPYNTITNGTYKTNILLSAPLRSLGAVKDRLFKDSDGKWKVERNVGEKVFNGTESWNKNDVAQTLNTLYYKWSSDFEGGWKQVGLASCSHLPFYDSSVSLINSPNQWLNDSVGFSSGENASARYFNFGKIIGIGTNNTNGVKAYLASEHSKGTPVTVQYQLVTPTYEILSQELQTKLDNIPAFQEHNYVYTITNDNLQPTLHVDYKKLSWLKSRLLLNSLKIYSRNLTDAEMIQNYKVEKERFGM